jgi:hypothetical protein
MAFRQLINSSDKAGEAVRQRLLGLVPRPQLSPDFR